MNCSAHAQIPAGRPLPVSVNGVVIARDAIQREMQHHPAGKPIAAWQQAARALVIRELLLQRARLIGLTPEPISDNDGRRETDDEALMRAVVEREVTVPEPDEATCRRFYERNQRRFRSPDIYEAAHILFAALPADPASLRAGARRCRRGARHAAGESGLLCHIGAGLFALPVGRAKRQSRPDHARPDHAGIRAGTDGADAR